MKGVDKKKTVILKSSKVLSKEWNMFIWRRQTTKERKKKGFRKRNQQQAINSHQV